MHDNWRNRHSNREPWGRRLVNCKKFCWQDSLFLLMLLNLQSAECFLSFVSFLFFKDLCDIYFFSMQLSSAHEIHIGKLKIDTFLRRRQLQPDVTSWFVPHCACSCWPPCRRGPVDDVKLVCLCLPCGETWVFNFHSNQLCCVQQLEFCRWSFFNCPGFHWVTFEARFPSSVYIYIYNFTDVQVSRHTLSS